MLENKHRLRPVVFWAPGPPRHNLIFIAPIDLKVFAHAWILRMFGYTLDLQSLADKLAEAREAGVRVEVGIDMRRTKENVHQCETVATLEARGVDVYGLSGKDIQGEYAEVGRNVFPATGICHVKRLRLGPYCLLGSTNWTTSSRCNIEQSFLVKLSPGEERRQYELEKLWFTNGVRLTADMLKSWIIQHSEKPRTRSVSRSRTR